MARIRTVKPEFWTSEQLAECTPIARLLFIGLWSFCDDNGIHPASVPRLKMEVFPADDYTRAQIGEMVEELVNAGLLKPYKVQGEQFWKVTGWHHQKIDQPTFKHPLPDGTLPPNVRRRFAEPDSPDVQRTFDERSPPEGKGEEGKGKEKIKGVQSSPSDDQPSPQPLILDNVTKHPASDVVQTVLASYHEALPNCQAIAVMNSKRLKRIQLADKLARALCKTQGWQYDTREFWDAYFGQCQDDPWLRGDAPNPKNPRWKQNLDVLLAEDRFAEIMDKAVAAMQAEDRAA